MKQETVRHFTLLFFLLLSSTLSFSKDIKTKKTIYFDAKISEKAERMPLVDKIIGYGTDAIDTIEIYTTNPLLFFNDNYAFDSAADIVSAFPNAKVNVPTDSDWYDAPIEVFVQSEYGDTLGYMCGIHQDNLPFNLSEGKLITNNLITISKFFRIGSTLDDVNEFLGLNQLGIPLKIISYRTIIISFPDRSWGICNSEFLRIIVDTYKNKIVSIRFE